MAKRFPSISVDIIVYILFIALSNFFFYIISGKMVLSKKRLSLQGGDLPSETDLPQETHVSFIATVRNSDVHSTIQRIYCGLILVTLCWQGHKSKKEVMMEIISKSKFYKVEYTCHLVILSLNILIYLGSVCLPQLAWEKRLCCCLFRISVSLCD